MLRGKYVKRDASSGVYYPTPEESAEWGALIAKADTDITKEKLKSKQIPKTVKSDLSRLESLRETVNSQNCELQALTEKLSTALVNDLGMTMREAADLLCLSHQRVHQLVSESKKSSKASRLLKKL
jgi:seryl-tRNA synthetase